jgi:hypothetical protein
MADSSDSDKNNKKWKDLPKPQVQTAFGAFGFTRKKRIKHNNETVEAMLPMHSVIGVGQTAADKRWTCDGCHCTFNSSQALGSHKNACDVYKDQMLRSVQGSTTIFAAFTNAPEGSTTAEKQRTLEGGNVNKSPPAAAILLNEDQDASSGDERAAGVDVGDKIPSLASQDGRKTNRGKATQRSYSNTEKADYIHQLEMFLDENPGSGVPEFVKARGLDHKFVNLLSKGKGKWHHPDVLDCIMSTAAKDEQKILRRTGKVVTLDKAKWPKMEFDLHQDIRKCRQRGARVSTNFIKTRAKQLMKKHYPNDDTFKASKGWVMRFKKHKKIKFRRRQNKKRLNIEEKHGDISFCMSVACTVLSVLL